MLSVYGNELQARGNQPFGYLECSVLREHGIGTLLFPELGGGFYSSVSRVEQVLLSGAILSA